VTPDPSSNQETEAALICGLAKEKAAKRERCLSQASDFPPIPAPVRHDVIGDLGALNQRAEARLLERRDMDEHILPPVSGWMKP
jgi:hypothetical protein